MTTRTVTTTSNVVFAKNRCRVTVVLTWLLLWHISTLVLVDGFFRRNSATIAEDNISTTTTTVSWASNSVTPRTTSTAAATTSTSRRRTTGSVAAAPAAVSTITAPVLDKKKKSLKPNVKSVIQQEERQFQQQQQNQRRVSNKSFHNDNNDDGKKSDDDSLVFEGTFEYQSDLLPMATTSSPKDLLDFFLQPEHRDLVLKGGGNPCDVIPSTPQLYDEWEKNSHIVRSTPPDGRHEEILAIYSDVHLAPGLSISATSYTGCKVLQEPHSQLPYYEFTLVKEDYHGKGRKPMVWVFDKVTGKANKNNNKAKKGVETTDDNNNNSHEGSRTYALSRVTIQPDAQQKGYRICYYGHVKVVSILPNKGMLRILPLPKRRVESKVSQSIVSQLEREGTKSVDKFTEALGNWTKAKFPHLL